MGVSTSQKPASRRAIGILLTLALPLLQWGCSSAPAEKAQTGADSPAAGAAATPARQAAQISAIGLADEGSTAAIEVKADRSLVWTSFRNADGDLVVELPNSEPAAGVGEPSPTGGLVSTLSVERVADGGRPLTRLVVKTREPSEHELTGDGQLLRLKLLPIDDSQQVALAYEPVAEEAPVEPAAPAAAPETTPEPVPEPEVRVASAPQQSAAQPQTYGTAESPQVGPAPTGVAASQLLSVQVLSADASGTQIQVVGDGELAYSTFRLQNPERFVIDLRGVVNNSPSSTMNVGSRHVEQVRVGQFKPRPEPVARVVFDLPDETVPTITRTSDGMIVGFGAPTAVAQVAPPAAPRPAPKPVPAAPEPVQMAAANVGDDEPTLQEELAAPPVARAEPAPAPPVPVYRPTSGDLPTGEAMAAAGTPRPSASADVAQFEAQQVPVDDTKVERERVLESLGSLVINRQEREYVGEPISMSLKNADLVETLRSFAKISDLNFVIQPGVRGSVTVELKAVPWDQAMEQILKINGLGMDIDGTIVRIAPTSQLRAEAEEENRLAASRQQTVPLRTVMRNLSYARAEVVRTLLTSAEGRLMSSRGVVQVYEQKNALIIRELPEVIDTVLSVIDNLDTAPPQVTIEARIVEATKTFSRTLGISWGYDAIANAENGNTTGLQFPNTIDSEGGVGLLTGGANGFIDLALGNIMDTFTLNARLQVAENEGLVNVVSAPRVTTLNNMSATIQSGLQIPIQTVSDRTVTVQYVNATLQLAVTPSVTAEGTIMLIINVAKRSPQPGLAVVGSSNAPIATKEANTIVIVRDGGTAVIGGIYEVSSNQGQDRVPGLANIPLLGHLFKNRNRVETNDELMIFVSPRIVQL
jgi:type IV pilus secretin PilQ/predicted competence protein